MTNISTEEAQNFLDDIDRIRNTIIVNNIYRNSPPYFLIWGVFYLCLNLYIHFTKGMMWYVFFGLLATAIVLSKVVGQLQSKRSTEYTKVQSRREKLNERKSLLLFGLWIGFILVMSAFMSTADGKSQSTLISLYAAFTYAAVGLWFGYRWIVIGVVFAASTIFCHFFVQSDYYLWAGIIGCSTLVVSSLLMAKV